MKTWKPIVLAAGMAAVISSGLIAAEPHASLYERLGGMPAIRAVVDDLVGRILADQRANHWFAHAAYKAKLADFICQGTGGPCHYTGADIVSAHRGRGITEQAFNEVVEDLKATLDGLHVPEKEQSDLLNILGPMKSAVVHKDSAQKETAQQ
jgi:hemoglobin